MLKELSIQNVVLIDKLELSFKEGLSVLTGETGAGKSILLDALGLVLGNRAETSLIRHGEEKLFVTAVFSIPEKTHPVFNLLQENEIESEDEIIVKRALSRDGKGKIFINDQPVTLKLLKDVGRMLVEIHGQFDNQGLLNPATHRSVIDGFGKYDSNLKETAEKYKEYKKIKHKRISAEKDILRAKEDEQNIRHWVEELEKLRPVKGEEETLNQKRSELMNAEKIIESLSFSYKVLTERNDMQSALRQAQASMDRANRIVSGKYDNIIKALEQTLINAIDAISGIEEASNSVALNSGEQENIESRLFALRGLARKHQIEIDDLPEKLEEFRKALNNVELGEDNLNALRKQEETAKLEYIKSANELTRQRKEAASKLDAKVVHELKPLKMEKARFVTEIKHTEEDTWNEYGFDNIEFTVSTNPNSPQGPINKIASGGELARFMLALKVNLSHDSGLTTMIFDEVDSGIGGATAEAVGERLSKLAQNVQVLVVTHSPQVAAKSDNHFKVEKETKNNITTTKVKKLNKTEKAEEIARMLAGERISDEARAAAKVLIGE